MECKSCKTERDYLYYMIPAYVMHHAMTGLLLFIFFVLFGKGYGRYWRFLIYFGTAAFEANMLLADHDPLYYILPSLTVFEKIEIIRQMNVTFFIALTHIGPSLFPEKKIDIYSGLKHLDKLSKGLEQQNCIQFVQGYEPFTNSPEAMSILKRKMGKLAVDMRLFKFQEIQQVITNMRRGGGSGRGTPTSKPVNTSSYSSQKPTNPSLNYGSGNSNSSSAASSSINVPTTHNMNINASSSIHSTAPNSPSASTSRKRK